KSGKLWDGVSDTYSDITDVFIENAKIVDTTSPDEVIDLSDYILMPGLINSHIHICLHCDFDIVATIKNDSESVTAVKAALNAQKTINAGVTTVRDLGSHFTVAADIKSMVDAGISPGPRIVHSAFLICTTGGHGWFFGREADGVDECRKAAREQIKNGASWIKLMATGGILTPGVSPECYQLNEDEMRVCCEEAHKAEKRAATHAQGALGVKNALRAGIDTVEHGFLIDDEAIELFLEKDAWLVPTLNAPSSTINCKDVPEFVREKSKRMLDGFMGRLEKAIKAGVKIGAGSDAGTPLNRHEDFYKEIVLLSQTGLGNLGALKCATSKNAELMGMENEIGRIAPGYCADLIAVKGDPLKNPNDLKNVVWVMKEGRIYRSDL
ncbi:MAG: amidohydrolase family protein, partial [bacterium]